MLDSNSLASSTEWVNTPVSIWEKIAGINNSVFSSIETHMPDEILIRSDWSRFNIDNPFDLSLLEESIKGHEKDIATCNNRIDAASWALVKIDEFKIELMETDIWAEATQLAEEESWWDSTNNQNEYKNTALDAAQEHLRTSFSQEINTERARSNRHMTQCKSAKAFLEAISNEADALKKYAVMIGVYGRKIQDERKVLDLWYGLDRKSPSAINWEYIAEFEKMRDIHACSSLDELIRLMKNESMNDFSQYNDSNENYGEYFARVAPDPSAWPNSITSKYWLRQKWMSLR